MEGKVGDPGEPAVLCRVHGRVVLSRVEYEEQMFEVDELWKCPHCGRRGEWLGTGEYE